MQTYIDEYKDKYFKATGRMILDDKSLSLKLNDHKIEHVVKNTKKTL